jgi:hypothetical protein
MSNTWDFLIQKDGETEWSKLTDLSSLPAGCYQLAAKSDRPKLNVDIRITHQDLKQANPPQTIASLSHRLDHEGFILLLPLTHLSAGQWQIHCFPSILAEMSGATWRTSLQFDITPVELLETPLEPPQKSSLLDFFRSMEMPELSPLPDVFTPTPHQFAYLEEAALTPELEAISQIHYEMETICQPVNIDAPLTPDPGSLSLDSSTTTNSVTVILPKSDSPGVPIPEELELVSSSPSVITELPFLDEIDAEDDQLILSELLPSLAELEEIEAEEIQTLFATVSSSELATDINPEETQAICLEELPLLEGKSTLDSSTTTNSVTVILPKSDSPGVPIPEELELVSSSPSVITELPFLDEIDAEDDQLILSELLPSLAELEEIEAEEIQTLFATVSSSELATDINPEETQAICLEELPLLEGKSTKEADENITKLSVEIPAIADTISSQDHPATYTHKREITYFVELSYPDQNRTFTIDVVVTEGDNHIPLDLQLPKLSVMRRRLHITSPKSTKILPPKLYPTVPPQVSQSSKKLQFTKFEPLQKVS